MTSTPLHVSSRVFALVLLCALSASAQVPQIKRFVPWNLVKGIAYSGAAAPVSAALSGKVLALGYPGAGVGGKPSAGLVLLINPDTGALLRVIRETDPDTGAGLGASLDISGHLLAVGAPGYQGGRGAVLVFDIRTGKQLLRVVNGAGAPNALGSSVALGEGIVAAGAPDTNVPGNSDQQGEVQIYNLADGSLKSVLVGSSPSEPGDQFGSRVAIQGRQLAVGAPEATSMGFSKAGAAYLMDWETSTLQSRLQASDPLADANYGKALAFTRQNLVLTADSGIYVVNARTFSQSLRIGKPPEAWTNFGQTLACLGMTAYVRTGLLGTDNTEIRVYDLVTGQQKEVWRPTLYSMGAGIPLAVDHRRIITGTFVEVIGASFASFGAIYSRSLPVASEPLFSMALIQPRTSPFGSGKPTASPQLGCRSNGQMGMLSRFQNPVPGFKSGAYLAIDELSADYDFPLVLAGTSVEIDELGLVSSSLLCTDITQMRVAHPAQTAFVGVGRNAAGTFPFLGIIDHSVPLSIKRFSIRRAGNDAAGAGSGKIARFLEIAQSAGSGADADVATRVQLQLGVDGVTKDSDSALLVLSTKLTLPPTTLTGAKEGQNQPGGGGILLGEINPQIAFSPGLICFTAYRQTLSPDNQATYSIDRAGNGSFWAVKGDLSSVGTVRTLLGFSANANNDRMVRFTTTGSGVNASNNEAYVQESGLTLRKGSPYPAAPAGLTWKRFLGFHPARGSNLIVHATVQGPKVTAANDGVVTLFATGSTPLTLLREGDLLPCGGGARIGSILKVDAQPGDPSGSYLILATLTGGPADSNLVVLAGRSSFGNNIVITPKLPFTMLRKGQWTQRPGGFVGKLTSVQLPGRNTNLAGFGGGGQLHWQGGDGVAVLQMDWDNKESEVVRARW